MTPFLIAFFLFLIGFIGAFLNDPGEFWLWFLALGTVLDLTLILLADLGEKGLDFVRKSETRVKICHFLALFIIMLAAYFRLKAEISWFFLFLGISLILWSYSILNLYKTWRRKSQNE